VRVLAGAAAGYVWGIAATVHFWAMFRGAVPAIPELALPLAVGAVALSLPFQAAMALEAALRRSSPGLDEVIAVTITCGVALGIAGALLVSRVRRTRAR
jgi:hypothetical protein